MQGQQQERRESILTESDFEKIHGMFVTMRSEIQATIARDREAWAESLGYDVSSVASRSEIRKDHELVRDIRRAKGKIMGAFFTGFGSSVVLWIWTAFKVMGDAQK
jgi:hypothetical protein